MQINQLLIYLAKSAFLAIVYLGLWNLFKRKIINIIIRSIPTGTITTLFFYLFSVNFIVPVVYFFYKVGAYPDPNGVTILLVRIYAKPVSIYLGIIIALALLLKKELLASLNIHSSNTNSRK